MDINVFFLWFWQFYLFCLPLQILCSFLLEFFPCVCRIGQWISSTLFILCLQRDAQPCFRFLCLQTFFMRVSCFPLSLLFILILPGLCEIRRKNKIRGKAKCLQERMGGKLLVEHIHVSCPTTFRKCSSVYYIAIRLLFRGTQMYQNQAQCYNIQT